MLTKISTATSAPSMEAVNAPSTAAISASTSAASQIVEVLLVRHAERLDEAPDSTIVNDRPWWDPPITSTGVCQARAAGERLQTESSRKSFERIFVSPCARTLQTASYMASSLGGGVVLCPVPGLAECAAAVQRMSLPAFKPDETLSPPTPVQRQPGRPHLERIERPRFLEPAQACRYCADGTRMEPTEPRYDETFAECMERLALNEGAKEGVGLKRILVVTHREGIRDLCEAAGVRGRVKTEYCCAVRYAFSTVDRSWTLLTPPTAKELPPSPMASLKLARLDE